MANLHVQIHIHEFICSMNSSNTNIFPPSFIKVISMGKTLPFACCHCRCRCCFFAATAATAANTYLIVVFSKLVDADNCYNHIAHPMASMVFNHLVSLLLPSNPFSQRFKIWNSTCKQATVNPRALLVGLIIHL
jgi:hypothetical protein